MVQQRRGPHVVVRQRRWPQVVVWRNSSGGSPKVRASGSGPAKVRASGSGSAKARSSSGGPEKLRQWFDECEGLKWWSAQTRGPQVVVRRNFDDGLTKLRQWSGKNSGGGPSKATEMEFDQNVRRILSLHGSWVVTGPSKATGMEFDQNVRRILSLHGSWVVTWSRRSFFILFFSSCLDPFSREIRGGFASPVRAGFSNLTTALNRESRIIIKRGRECLQAFPKFLIASPAFHGGRGALPSAGGHPSDLTCLAGGGAEA
ncbi:hypothetical protein KFK09_014444 [Dendrobium nobile]|uniref:Uncharacterized protein n=1 Tax=Dendrobium nobile TaxID=94219 RepID=A0A8T3B255_DENNO|nr:hypothetical protein KFK09_014444 [Dendrobium nobile]